MYKEKLAVLSEELELIRDALQAPTHEANDYNCEDWPIGQGCSGCKGDELREGAVSHIDIIKGLFQQARQETAQQLIEEIEEQEIIQRTKGITIWLDCHWWQSLKSKFLEDK